MQDLMERRAVVLKELNLALGFIATRGRELAQAEKSYKIAMARCILEHRTNGDPVTIIPDLCKGKPEVADLRFDRDSKQALYRSALEAVNVKKLELRVIEEDMNAERRGM
jgi:predicted RNA-binding protein